MAAGLSVTARPGKTEPHGLKGHLMDPGWRTERRPESEFLNRPGDSNLSLLQKERINLDVGDSIGMWGCTFLLRINLDVGDSIGMCTPTPHVFCFFHL